MGVFTVFSNLKIGARLSGVFALIVTTMVAVVAFSYVNLSRYSEANGWNTHTYQVLEQSTELLLALVNIETGQRGFMLGGKEAFLEPLNNGKAAFEKAHAKIKALTSDNPTQQDRLDKLRASYTSWLNDAVMHGIQLRRNVGNDSAKMDAVVAEIQSGNGKIQMDSMRKLLHDIDDMERALLDGRAKNMDDIRSVTQATMVVGSLIAVILSAILALWITRSITRPLAQAVDVADKLSAGDLSSTFTITGKDEPAALLTAMQTMQGTLSDLISDIKQQASASGQGDFSKQIKLTDKRGFGKEISETLNQLATTTDGALTDISRIASALAVGDLSKKIDKSYPGIFGTTSSGINETVSALNTIVSEIKVIVEAAAARGDFSRRLDMNGKVGFGKDLAELLNQLSTVTETGLSDISRIASALAKGDLSQKIDKTYPGIFGQTSTGINGTVDALNAIVSEIQALVEAAAERGDFSRRLDLNGKLGFGRNLAELLNNLSTTTSTGLNDVARVLKSVAQGDLTQAIEKEYVGIFDQLKDDTNTTVARLVETVGRIKDAADLINTASREIAAGNADLSRRTEEQASSLEETASSMEELSGTVKRNADNATQTNALAGTSNDIAVKSGQMVQEIVVTMSGISESSKKIADIIGVIDSIAFQTNILALNAAVEAARAGEQGRGFAVVATEVRNLAQRSATAAKEIKELIAESTGKVDAGTRLVSQAGVSMDQVVTSFREVTALVTDIASASNEQSSGIEQVSQAIVQMDQVTQQNAALVEQAAASAESLEEQVQTLVNAVAMFKLDAGVERSMSARNVPGPALRTASAPRQLSPGASSTQAKKLTHASPKLAPAELTQDSGEWAEF